MLHCHWGVGVRVLLARLPLHQQIRKGSCSTPLCHSQSLVMMTCSNQRSKSIKHFLISSHKMMRRRNCWAHTQADQDPLKCLVAGGLQVKQGEFIVCAVLCFMADGLKQCRCSVELKRKKTKKTSDFSLVQHALSWECLLISQHQNLSNCLF